MVMVLLFPTFLLANAPAAEAVDRFTASPLTTPTSEADPLLRSEVAEVDASYTLSLAVMPDTVRVLEVIFADELGCVSE